jgi:uncharacterized membrane protein YhaH (DUF805 family)
MSPIFDRLHDIGTRAWLRFVQILNWVALSAAVVIVAVNAMYPKAVEDVASALPPVAKFAALAAWAALVHYAIRRAKVSPND